MKIPTSLLIAAATTVANNALAAHAFVAPSHHSRATTKILTPITPMMNPTAASPKTTAAANYPHRSLQKQSTTFTTTTTTSLRMGYQLPPSGGGGPKGPFEQLQSILPTIGTGILVALFFASPLGGAFFAIFNSLFVLALLTPVILIVGFQVWTALYTVEAPCPSCGALPVRALKSGEPSVCLNCGAYSRVNVDGNGLELCNNPNDVMGGGGLFDSLFGMGGNGMSDFVDVDNVVSPSSSSGGSGGSSGDPAKKGKKSQGTIIDVDVERD
eukprot:CAMPEP_0183707124 /NCGR_PEP_ID=MMETSP0737-20130205/3771_1 /TAXON_ID=385413 /ORGANISM="Thalassiosira miniscula, Strain CCMP1093" /LENGTH=269 /DNA_ID=CAMNT_0025934705 /DNA_START=101 /DNA_END=910 /DNA_ORIENTATION=-